ncbi:MAG: histidinol-phosphate aminotransferase [Candidatus Latescibacterota bacterium]|jgi:histidinol-phosphate aminotransferase
MNDTNTFFRPNIAHMEGYIPGEQPQTGNFIKLNTNENPYPPPARVLDRLRQACTEDLRLYPDPGAAKLRQLLADTFGTAPEQFMVGNGSDELLTIIIRSFAGEGDKIAYPYPTYGYYKSLIEIQGAQCVEVDFPEDFSLPAGLAKTGAHITFLVNPNAPSGTLLPIDDIAALAAQIDGILVVDEAYVDFSEGGSIALVEEHANTIVVRTMSKSFSLAGMRIGFACAQPELIAGMWKVKDHYNLNRLSLVAAEAALEEIESMRQNAERICRTRDRLTLGLRQLGFHVWDSAANFALARSTSVPAAKLYRELKERRILVRHFDQPRLDDCLRITVGTDEEIEALLNQLQDILTT